MINKSKIILLCGFMEITLLIGAFVIPFIGQIIIWLPVGDSIPVMGGAALKINEDNYEWYINKNALSFYLFLKDCIVSLILWFFYNVFKDIRGGEVFKQKQINRISIAGWCLVSLSIYSLSSDLFFSLSNGSEANPDYYFNVDNVIYIPIGIGLVILSHVIRLAKVIKEEQELII